MALRADYQPTSLQSRRQQGPSLFDDAGDDSPIPESVPSTESQTAPGAPGANAPEPRNVQTQSSSEIIERFPGEEGTEAVVAKISGNRYSVALRDVDADQYVNAVKIFPALAPAIDYAKIITRQTSITSKQEDADSRTADQKAQDRLLGQQLTAQAKSGMAARPTKLKPAKNRGLFDEEGPEQETLFARQGEETGPHGPITREFYHDPAGAITWLRERETGEAVAALHPPRDWRHRPDLGR